jgi:hypothetical protein
LKIGINISGKELGKKEKTGVIPAGAKVILKLNSQETF